jgi:photosystem II stability/assembly factor-like uncharacterized protein
MRIHFSITLTMLLLAATAQSQPKERRIYCCMYQTPAPGSIKMLRPVYIGVAASRDMGATWKSMGWRTNRTNDIACDPARPAQLYLANDYGLLVSGDDGATWKIATSDSIPGVLSVKAFGDTVLLGTPTGVFVSTDRGATLTQRNTGLRALNGTYVSCVLPLGGVWLAGTADGVYRSSDAGASWHASGLAGKAVDRMVAGPAGTDVLAAFNARDGIWLSEDRGRTWTPFSPALPTTRVQAVLFPTKDRKTVIVATKDQGVLRSTDGGATWTNSSGGMQNLNVTALARDPDDEAVIWAGTENGAYISDNRGATWKFSALQLGTVSSISIW